MIFEKIKTEKNITAQPIWLWRFFIAISALSLYVCMQDLHQEGSVSTIEFGVTFFLNSIPLMISAYILRVKKIAWIPFLILLLSLSSALYGIKKGPTDPNTAQHMSFIIIPMVMSFIAVLMFIADKVIRQWKKG